MRDSNFSFPVQNRPAVSISAQIYDRRAIDAPVPSLPLISSLSNLTMLTASSPKIRDIMTQDGGLERLIEIIRTCIQERPHQARDGTPFLSFVEQAPSASEIDTLQHSQKFKQNVSYQHICSLAFQCVANIGVRGSEFIRTRAVESGALEIVVRILEIYKDSVADLGPHSPQVRSSLAPAMAPPSYDDTVRNDVRGLGLGLPGSVRIATDNEPSFEDAEIAEDDNLLVPQPTVALMAEQQQAFVSQAMELQRPNLSFSTAGPSSLPGSSPTVDADGDVEMGELEEDQPASDVLVEELGLNLLDFDSVPSERRRSMAYRPSFRSEDVSLALQLLAYLSKYPHVRMIFHANSVEEQENLFDDTVSLTETASVSSSDEATHDVVEKVSGDYVSCVTGPSANVHNTALLMNNSGCEKPIAPATNYERVFTMIPLRDERAMEREAEEKGKGPLSFDQASADYYHLKTQFYPFRTSADSASCFYINPVIKDKECDIARSFVINRVRIRGVKNVFLLVEQFTQRSPVLPNEAQYWACVIMRNACRKDESRGGIRQCANMACGAWESYPHQFAKCRRCRKAKYCSKSCQATAWTNGHRNWCSRAQAGNSTNPTDSNANEDDSQ